MHAFWAEEGVRNLSQSNGNITYQWQFAVLTGIQYLEEMAIFSRTVEEYIDHVQLVLTLLSVMPTTLNENKYWLSTNLMDYLDPVIRLMTL